MPEILQHLPDWGWHVWLIGFLFITLLFALEGSYQLYAKEHQRAEALACERAFSCRITIQPSRLSETTVLPSFIINTSPSHRIVLDFTLYVPLSNASIYHTTKFHKSDQFRIELGPEEHTSGYLYFILGTPRDSNVSFLFNQAYLVITDGISSQSATVSIPGHFP